MRLWSVQASPRGKLRRTGSTGENECAAHKLLPAIRKVFDLSLLLRLPANVRCGRRCRHKGKAAERIKAGAAGEEMGVDLFDFDHRHATRPAKARRTGASYVW